MILRCGSCSATLRADEKRLAGRTSARCPKCSAIIPIVPDGQQARAAASGESVITVACGSCHATLRAAASRAGTRSRCPKCHAEVLIEQAPLPAPTAGEDSSSVATRRIDSRSLGLGMMGLSGARPAAGDVDVDDFLKAGQRPASPAPSEGIADTILHPPTAPIRVATQDIREAAEAMSAAAPRPERPRDPSAGRAGAGAVTTDSAPLPVVRSQPAPAARHVIEDPFPVSRGLAAGAIAGAMVGGAWWLVQPYVTTSGFGWTIAPLYALASISPLPHPATRALILLLLGAAAGFVAGAFGAPSRSRRPLSLIRCGAVCLLAGAASGMALTLLSAPESEAFSLWPTANWMRDLVLVGLLTPAFNRLLPGSR